jgi:hypothetical protein
MMQPYKGYFIKGSALLVHPSSPDWYVGGSILAPGRSSSVVEITRFQLQQFTVGIKELACPHKGQVQRTDVCETGILQRQWSFTVVVSKTFR